MGFSPGHGRSARKDEVRPRTIGTALAGRLAGRPLPGAPRAGAARLGRRLRFRLGKPALSLGALQLLPAHPRPRPRVAAEAGTMSLGTGVLLLPLHHPVDIAEQIATLDVICGGPLHLRRRARLPRRRESGRGTGSARSGWAGSRGARGHRAALDGRAGELCGPALHLEDVRISMPPHQRPRPPIWLAANADVGVKRAARLGDAWLMNPHTTLATLERQLALFQRDAEGPRQAAGDGDPAHQGMLRRAGPAARRRRGAPLPRAEVRGLSPVGTGQGAAGRRELRVGLRSARARPLPAGRPGARQGRDRPLPRAPRRHHHNVRVQWPGHGAGQGSAHHPAPGRAGLPSPAIGGRP